MSNNSTKKPLSARLINVMKPGDKIKDAGENTGLNVSCNKSGVKTFFYRYRSPNHNLVKRVTLGIYVSEVKNEVLDAPIGKKLLGLSSARQILALLKEQRKAGICPSERLKQEIAEKENEQKVIDQKEARLTIKEIVEVYLTQQIEDHVGTDGKVIKGVRKLKGQKETRRTLENVVGRDYPSKFGSQIAEEISHTEIKKLISSIIAKGTKVQAGRVLSELKLAYGFCIGSFDEKGEYLLPDDMVNPCIQAKEFFKDKKKIKLTSKPCMRNLKDNELMKLLKWLPESKFTQISKDALMLVLFTGVRSGEAVVAEKADFDLGKGVWLVNGKTEVERYVQLSAQAIKYIRPILENKNNTTIYLLPTQNKVPQAQKKLSEQAWVMRRDGDMLNIPRWTAHDLRRTVRTQLSRLGCPSIVGEAVLGHSKKGMMGVYDLHQYEGECSVWLQKLADHYDTLGQTVRKSYDDFELSQ